MVIIDFVGIVGIIGFLLSLGAFLYQLHRNKIIIKRQDEWKNALISRSQASYNYFYSIAQNCDFVRNNPVDKSKILMRIDRITGIADTARSDIVSYCRSHLDGYIPFYEHPAHPGSAEPVDTSCS